MKPLLILSVKHSGTRTLKNFALKNHESRYEHIEERPAGYPASIAPSYAGVLVPMRHPLDLAISWVKRGYNFEELLVGLERLATVINDLDPCFIPIDQINKDFMVLEANERLGLDMPTGEWPLIGHDPEPKGVSDEQMDQLVALWEKHSDFFDKWF